MYGKFPNFRGAKLDAGIEFREKKNFVLSPCPKVSVAFWIFEIEHSYDELEGWQEEEDYEEDYEEEEED